MWGVPKIAYQLTVIYFCCSEVFVMLGIKVPKAHCVICGVCVLRVVTVPNLRLKLAYSVFGFEKNILVHTEDFLLHMQCTCWNCEV